MIRSVLQLGPKVSTAFRREVEIIPQGPYQVRLTRMHTFRRNEKQLGTPEMEGVAVSPYEDVDDGVMIADLALELGEIVRVKAVLSG